MSCNSASYLTYQISTNTDPYITVNTSTFDLKLSEHVNQNKIIEKKMLKMAENALLERGWKRSITNPDYYVSLTFSISDGVTTTSTTSIPRTKRRSNYNYKTNTTTYTKDKYTQVISRTNTTFERKINIYFHSQNGDLVWQGDLISHGTTQDVMYIAPHLIPVAIRYIGYNDISGKYRHDTNVADKKQSKPLSKLVFVFGLLTSIIIIASY
tara:strand:- start:185 stop:817 length:633 start_codon:yes stop_codon:yes gene_type:complete